jgi:hypothetical protein
MELNLPEHVIWIVLMVVVIAIVIVIYLIFQGGGIQNLSKIFGFLKIFG